MVGSLFRSTARSRVGVGGEAARPLEAGDGHRIAQHGIQLFPEKAVKKNAEHNERYQHIHPVMLEREGKSRK